MIATRITSAMLTVGHFIASIVLARRDKRLMRRAGAILSGWDREPTEREREAADQVARVEELEARR